MQWLRLYHDTPTDPKWRLVAVESEQTVATVLAIWTCMLVNASQAAPRGTLQNWNDRVVGACLDLKGSAVTAVREAMQGIVLDGDVLTGWDKRQRTNDSSTERVRRYRERAMLRNQIAEAAAASAGTSGIQSPADTSFSHTAATENYGVPETVGNGDVTVTSGLVTVTNGNVTVTERSETVGSVFSSARADTDSDTDSERIPPYPPMGGAEDLFSSGLARSASQPSPANLTGLAGSPDLLSPATPSSPESPAAAASSAGSGTADKPTGKQSRITLDEIEEAFARFKIAYPKRINPHTWSGKKGAKAKFFAAVSAGVDREILIDAAGRYAAAMRVQGKVGTESVADALTWLNQHRWEIWIEQDANPKVGNNNIVAFNRGQQQPERRLAYQG